jgi:hypothetical protein
MVEVQTLRSSALGRHLDCKYILVPGSDGLVSRVIQLQPT